MTAFVIFVYTCYRRWRLFGAIVRDCRSSQARYTNFLLTRYRLINYRAFHGAIYFLSHGEKMWRSHTFHCTTRKKCINYAISAGADTALSKIAVFDRHNKVTFAIIKGAALLLVPDSLELMTLVKSLIASTSFLDNPDHSPSHPSCTLQFFGESCTFTQRNYLLRVSGRTSVLEIRPHLHRKRPGFRRALGIKLQPFASASSFQL